MNGTPTKKFNELRGYCPSFLYIYMQRVKIYININKMKELNIFRQFLAEEQVEEQVEGKVYVVMVGRPGEPKGPIKAFMDKASAEQHAVQFKQDYEDRFKGNELSSFIQEVPMG